MATAAVLLAGASLLATGGTSGAVPFPASGSAFGVSATGLVDVAPTPTAPPDETVASIDEAPTLVTGILTATANLDEATGDFTSTATIADLRVLTGAIGATAVESNCTASGDELTGDASFATITIAGALDVPIEPPPNTEIIIPAVATVILNEQVTSEDGQTLTVNAIRVTLLNGTQEVIAAQSVCTLAGDDGTTIPTTPTTGDTTPTTGDTTPTTGDTTPTTGGTTPPTVGTTPVPTPVPTAPRPPTAAPGATPVAGSPNFTG